MNGTSFSKALALGAALLAGPLAGEALSNDLALAAGAGKQSNGVRVIFAAVGDPHSPSHSTGAVLVLTPSGAISLEGVVSCLSVTGNRALLKGPIVKPASQAGRTFILSAVDRDVPVSSAVPDEVGVLNVPASSSCPGTTSAPTLPLVQGDVVVFSSLNTNNDPPVASAGPDQSVPRGSTVTLDGGASSDPNGDPLTYSWSLVSVPAGSAAHLSNPAAVRPTFVADRVGDYVARLVVNDGAVSSPPDTATVTAFNLPPAANAGPDQTVPVGQTVTLDGTGSTDPNGDPLTYSWSLVSVPSGSTATLSNPTAVMPTFRVDRPGTYVAQLVANDGTVSSPPDTISVSTLNSPPVANAGADQSAYVGDTVTLDGSGSTDIDGDPLTYSWTLVSVPAGSAAALSNPTAVMPTLLLDEPGTYVVQLVVNDGSVSSAPDSVTVSTLNSPPVANAGTDQSAYVGDTVTLDGSGSTDVDGDPLFYSWSLLSVPAGSAATLSDPTAAGPTFVLDRAGTYVAQLIVSDGTAASVPDTVTVSTLNSAPIAHAGADQNAFVGDTVTLDGSGSTDVDGNPLTYSWSLLSVPAGSAATLSDPTSVMPTFVVDRPGAYVAQLVVHDGTVSSAPDTVTVSTVNSAPVARAGADQSVYVGDTVTLDGSASTDADGDPLTYFWSLLSVPAGSAAILSDPSAVMPTFLVDRPGTYVAQLVVHDGTVPSAPDTVTVTTLNSAPIANAGADQSPFVGDTVTLDGSASTDADGDPLTYFWSLLSVPTGSAATLSNPTAVMPSFVVDRPGDYVVQLVVDDGTVSSAPDTVAISTINSAPVANAGPDQSVYVGDTVTLDGTASTDADGDPLTFLWSLLSVPAGSAATLSDPTAAMPSFDVDRPGSYVAQLVVNDGTVSGAPDTVSVSTLNSAPVADAGPDLSVFVGDTVTLDGSGSSDPDDQPLTYLWTIVAAPQGSTATLSDPTAVMPSFTPSVDGVYIVELVVNDGFLDSAPDTVIVTVARHGMALATSSPLVGIGRTIDGSVTLDVPAPAGGVQVQLTADPAGSVTIAPATALVAEGASTASFTVTGLVAGPATVHGSAAAFTDASVDITVTANLINLAAGVVTSPGQSAILPVSLSQPAPAGGLTVSLSSSDPLIATVTSSVFVPEGATVPESNPLLTGVRIGTVQITGTAPDYAPHTVGAISTLSLSFTPSPFTVAPGESGDVTLHSSVPAPPGGLDVAVSIDATTIATAPPAVFIPEGQASVVFSVAGVTVGSTTLRANTAGVGEATLSIQVRTLPTISIPDLTIGKDLQAGASATLGAPAPIGGVQLTIASADPARALLSTSATAAGTASLTLTIPTGSSTSPGFFVQSLADSGSVQITASATGYSAGAGSVTQTPSGFVINSPAAIDTTTLSPNTSITIALGRLSPGTLAFVATQDLRGGLTASVPVTSSDTRVGTITVSPVVFNGGSSLGSTAFDPENVGTTTIAVQAPAGFSTPSTGQQITATVTGPDITLPALTIGKDLQASANATLEAPAPAGGVQVTITSADPARALVSSTATAAGGASLTLTIAAGASTSPGFFVQSLADSGSVEITASATGYGNGTGTVTQVPAGFVINSPASISTTTLSTNTSITIVLGRLNPATLAFVALQNLRGGLTASLPVTSSDTNVGVITVSPVVFNAATSLATTAFDPQNVGTTTIALQTPAGFSTPSNGQQITATVTGPAITLPNLTVGKDLQTGATANLGAPAPTGGVQVTITSVDPARALLSSSATAAGGASLTLTVSAGLSSTPTFFVQSLADSGSAQITASATGFGSGTGTITQVPSGFVISSPASINTTSLSANTPIQIASGRLNPGTLAFLATQALRGGLSASVPVTSSDASVGVITVSPVVINGGASSASTAFDPQNVGTTTIAVQTPAGFSTPSTQQQITATVATAGITFANQTIGKDLQVSATATLGAPAPTGGVQLTITSADPTRVLVSSSATAAGSASITLTVAAGASTSPGFFIQALAASDTVQVTASAAGFNTATATMTLHPSGFIISSPLQIVTNQNAPNVTVTIRPARLDPALLLFEVAQAVRGGLTVSVPVTSSNTTVGVITISPLVFSGGVNTLNTAFDPLAPGTTIISTGTPPGFSTPSNMQQITATVNPL